jgi:ribosome-associated heat shock protein Hsp15
VLGVSAVRGPAPQAALLYHETEASVVQRQAQAEQRRLAPEPALDLEQGRPTKRDRRQMEALRSEPAPADWDQRWSASWPGRGGQ